MTSGGALMPRARTAAHDATADVRGITAKVGGADPVDALIERMRPVAARSVDALQVAAWLEASGMTDRAARAHYGYLDVFDLAGEICRRVAPAPDPPRPSPAATRAVRDVGHGALYLLPVVVFPAMLAALGANALVPGVVVVAGVCWVCSGAVAWLAYRLLGSRRPASAGRVLRWASLAGLPLAAAAGALLAGDRGAGFIVLAVAQMAYQMGVTVLVFYRREASIFAAMAPAAVAGIAFLVIGRGVLGPAITLAALSVVVTFGVALHAAGPRGDRPEPPLWQALRANDRRLIAVTAYTTLTAAYFLYPQAYFLPSHFGIAIGALPVIVGMGVVEWQAHRFRDDGNALLGRVSQPIRFALHAQMLLLRGLGVCLAAVAAVAVVLLAALAVAGGYSAGAAVMATASVLLAGAFFLAFLLADLGRYALLCANLMTCLTVYVAITAAARVTAMDATIALAATTTLLLLLNLAALSRDVGHASRHRR